MMNTRDELNKRKSGGSPFHTVKQDKNAKKTKDASHLVFILSAVAAALALIIFLFIFTSSMGRQADEQNRQYLIDNATGVARQIDQALTDGSANIRILSELVSKTMTGTELDVAGMQNLIRDSVFDFVEYADKDGVNHNITGGESDASDRKYYLDAKEGNSGRELILVSRATKETLLVFYAPLTYRGQFAGSLLGIYQATNRITDCLQSRYLGQDVATYFVNAEGRILAANGKLEPQKERMIWELAEGNRASEDAIRNGLKTDSTSTFPLPGNSIGGCMVKLSDSDEYVVQVFPVNAVNGSSVKNTAGFRLAAVILLLALIILVSMVAFFRRQQRTVKEAKQQAEEANKAKTRFLFSLSHDVRTPMNAIMGFTNMAIKNVDDREKVLDNLNKSLEAEDLLLSVINNIQDMDRIESGNISLDEKTGDVYLSFSDIENAMKEMAKSKNISLNFEVENISDRYVYADFSKCNRVFVNIISNAVKYTKEGGFINARCEQIGRKGHSGVYRYTFEDNGIGMSDDLQKRIFTEFSKDEVSTINDIQETGLALSVCKNLVTAMNGTIECQSMKGVGTTFVITLPFRVQDSRSSIHTETKPVTQADEEAQDSAIDFFGKRVLLVEDNVIDREIASELLGDEGLLVDTAENGEVAVQKVKEQGTDYYDFILMDIQMPVMDGYEATMEIRRSFPESEIPIIALSANAFDEDRAKSLSCGMNDHVAKPIHMKELIAVLKKHAMKEFYQMFD